MGINSNSWASVRAPGHSSLEGCAGGRMISVVQLQAQEKEEMDLLDYPLPTAPPATTTARKPPPRPLRFSATPAAP